MELIVAVYDDWGIGCCGTQPIALSADRKFFREQTRGAMVIVGRKTLAEFPGGKPLPNRVNVVLPRGNVETEGGVVCHSPEEAAELAKTANRAMVIGGGSVYRQMLPMCDTAIITKVHTVIPCDTYFHSLDEDPAWQMQEVLQTGEEDGIGYEMCVYKRI